MSGADLCGQAELCTGKLFQFEDQDQATLKGFPEPVRLLVAEEGD